MKRREFVIGCSAAIAATAGSQLESFAFSPQPNATQDIFVLVFLRGGCDALNFVAPVNDKNYYAARPARLRLTESGEHKGLELKNGLAKADFRIHQKAEALHEIYESNQMAIVHACGLANGTRSHFDAMDLIERGINKKGNISEGWLTRYLNSVQLEGMLPAVAAEEGLPKSLIGSNQATSIQNLAEFKIHADARYMNVLKDLYQGDDLLGQTARETISTLKDIQKRMPKNSEGQYKKYQPTRGSNYPEPWEGGGLSQSLQTVAQLIKMEVGLKVATLSFGGWDTHENQSYHFTRQINLLSRALGAFYNDVNNYHNRLTVLVMSEFGRRLKANKSGGTDHGHGGIALALGGNVKGGKMYGQWPGLATDQLDNRVDLAVTTDYRAILSEILQKRLNSQQLSKIFPGFGGYKPLGFV
ncbi:hypothetical protein BKI52_22155 [marine bacterium AO1-C]|nr:hypothetical protein BKI52_22155 [marine bacterium AO1-C]